MQADNSNQPPGKTPGISERLHAIESSLRAITASPAVDAGGNEVIARALQELAAIRAELDGAGTGTGGQDTGATTSSGATAATAADKASADASLDASVEHDRLKRAISEIKSGEFDVQG